MRKLYLFLSYSLSALLLNTMLAPRIFPGTIDDGSSLPKPAHPPMVEVVAGSSSNGDGGDASEAVFVGIAGLAVDPAGNVFLSDSGANRVRKIDAKTGTISTIAGNGSLEGESGTPRDATEVKAPGPLALDSRGLILFVGEIVGRRVRRIDTGSGAMEDLGAPQGGWGRISGLLWTENGLFVADAQLGQVFLLKAEHHWVGMVPPGLKLNKGIRTMAADSKGRIYISEYFAHRVLRIDPQSGSVAVFAGTGEPGLARDGMISTEAPLRSPDGLAFDQEGKLLVADSGNRRICRIDIETGQISTFASSDTSGSDDKWTPGSIAVDASGSVWVGDSERDRLLHFSSGALTPKVYGRNEDLGDGGPAIQARLAHPSSVVSDRAGNIYISDTLHHRIRVVNARSGRISTVAGTGVPGYNGDDIPANTARLNYPAHIQIDNYGKLYIGDYYNNRVRVVDLRTKRISTLAGTGPGGDQGDGGPAASATLSNPHVLYLDGRGSLIITSAVSSSIRRIDLKTGIISAVSTDRLPRNQVVHGVGLWNGALLLVVPRPLPGRIDAVLNGKRSTLIARPELLFPYHVAVSPDGDLYICEAGRGRILRWNGSELSVVVDGIGRPRAISFDSGGNLLIAETFHNRVLRVWLNQKPAEPPGTRMIISSASVQ